MRKIDVQDHGLMGYTEMWAIQQRLFDTALVQKKDGISPSNFLLLCEHAPVYTLGKRANEKNLLVEKEKLNAEVIQIDRGGDVTFHGPGQLVVYPILDLEQFGIGLAKYIELLEQCVINVLKTYNIDAGRTKEAPGVWLDLHLPSKTRKICAIGVRSSRYVTMHGLAFNVYTDLDYFDKMIPCGIGDKGVTSLKHEIQHSTFNFQHSTSNELLFEEVKRRFVAQFCEVFNAKESKEQ